MEATPRFLRSAAIFFGPRLGILTRSTRPGSIEAFSLSRNSRRPVAWSSAILDARASPIPFTLCRVPSATIFPKSSFSRASIARAPAEYARTLNGFSPFSSISVPISASTSAISFFVMRAFQTAIPPSSTQ